MKQKRNIIFATALTLSLSFSTANAGNLSLNNPSMVAVKDNTFIKVTAHKRANVYLNQT